MVLVDLGFSILLALVIALLLSVGLGRRGPGPLAGILFFFIFLWLGIWAGGIWLTPVGPPLWDAPFLSFLFVALFLILLVTVLMPPSRPTKGETPVEQAEVAATGAVLGFSFWVLIVLLAVAIAARYLWMT